MADWEPLFEELRSARAPDVLHETVTPWLASPLAEWIDAHMERPDGYQRSVTNAELITDIQTACQLDLSWAGHGAVSARFDLKDRVKESPTTGLEVANFLLSLPRVVPDHSADRLERTLENARSVWQVVPADDERPRRLERRVQLEVTQRFEEVSNQGRSGAHLREAWSAMYGQAGNASAAYREAVKAVEASGAPVFTPKDGDATLGKMIRAFRDKPEKWNVALGSMQEQGRQAIIEMMKGVWHGQYDRHGTPDEARPASVSHAEAEAALHAAVTLVHFLNAGLVEPS